MQAEEASRQLHEQIGTLERSKAKLQSALKDFKDRETQTLTCLQGALRIKRSTTIVDKYEQRCARARLSLSAPSCSCGNRSKVSCFVTAHIPLSFESHTEQRKLIEQLEGESKRKDEERSSLNARLVSHTKLEMNELTLAQERDEHRIEELMQRIEEGELRQLELQESVRGERARHSHRKS
jgi:anti-sigma28 factor (negative regulator of flagellin synthesis)